MGQWMATPYGEQLGHIAKGQTSVHLLGFYDCQSGIVLAQRAVASKENAHSAAAALVHPALVKGLSSARIPCGVPVFRMGDFI